MTYYAYYDDFDLHTFTETRTHAHYDVRMCGWSCPSPVYALPGHSWSLALLGIHRAVVFGRTVNYIGP